MVSSHFGDFLFFVFFFTQKDNKMLGAGVQKSQFSRQRVLAEELSGHSREEKMYFCILNFLFGGGDPWFL